MTTRALLAAALLLASAVPARAEVPAVPEVPRSPAFTALDVSPTVVSRPTTAGSLGTSLLSGVDASGHLLPGVSLDVAPLWLRRGGSKTLTTWRHSRSTQLASRWTVSAASAAIPGSARGAALAVATRLVLVDDSDPRLDATLEECVRNGLDAPGMVDPTPLELDEKTDTAPTRAASTTVEQCKDQARAKRRDRGWALAIATSYSAQSNTAKLSDLVTYGVDAWTDVSYGFTPNDDFSVGVGAGVRYRYLYGTDASAADLGLQMRVQYINRVKLLAAASWKPQNLGQLADSADAFAFGGELELRLFRDNWLQLQVSYQGGDDAPWSGVLSTGSIRQSF
jgi:hypothetical protein